MSSSGSKKESLELLSYSPDKESTNHYSSNLKLIQSNEKINPQFKETIEAPSHFESSPVYSYYTMHSGLYVQSNSFYQVPKVFDRLIEDANKRTDRKMKITELIRNNEINSAPSYTENEEVYGRLLKDTKFREEQARRKENYKKLIENEEVVRYQSKRKLTKSQTNAVITRLVRNLQIESPRKELDQKYVEVKQRDFTKTLNIDTITTLPYTPRLKTDRSFKRSQTNCRDLEKDGKEKPEKVNQMSMLERLEIEKCYGKPGKPKNPNENITQAVNSSRKPGVSTNSAKKNTKVLTSRLSKYKELSKQT